MPDRGRRVLIPDAARRRRNRHRILAFGAAAAVAVAVELLLPRWPSGPIRFVADYDAGALVLLVLLWSGSPRDDAEATRRRAALEDPGRDIILGVVLLAVVAGLLTAVVILGHGPKTTPASHRWTAYGLGIVAVAVGWCLVHTVYTFRYAHLYWFDDDGDGGAGGGIIFPQTPAPCDLDFAYFAFCIGTSFAVSDPQVTVTRIRREIIGHSIIAFAYNSVIIGLIINLFAGIFSSSS